MVYAVKSFICYGLNSTATNLGCISKTFFKVIVVGSESCQFNICSSGFCSFIVILFIFCKKIIIQCRNIGCSKCSVIEAQIICSEWCRTPPGAITQIEGVCRSNQICHAGIIRKVFTASECFCISLIINQCTIHIDIKAICIGNNCYQTPFSYRNCIGYVICMVSIKPSASSVKSKICITCQIIFSIHTIGIVGIHKSPKSIKSIGIATLYQHGNRSFAGSTAL